MRNDCVADRILCQLQEIAFDHFFFHDEVLRHLLPEERDLDPVGYQAVLRSWIDARQTVHFIMSCRAEIFRGRHFLN